MRKSIIKRTFAAVLAIGVLTTGVFLTGCGKTQSSDNKDTSGKENVKTIYAATSGSPSPYITVDEQNNPSGYDIEVIQKVFEKLPNYKLELQVADFDAVLTGVTSGTYQIAVNNLSYRKERAETYYFSYPYDKIKYVFIQRKGDKPLTSLKDAADRGYTIEAGAGNNVTNAVEQWNKENPDHQIKIKYTEADLPVVFQHIQDGESDFRIDDLPIYVAYQKEYNFEKLEKHEISAEETEKIAPQLNAYFLFAKNEEGEALRKEVNDVLKELKDDGTLAELSKKYFEADQVPDDADFEKTVN